MPYILRFCYGSDDAKNYTTNISCCSLLQAQQSSIVALGSSFCQCCFLGLGYCYGHSTQLMNGTLQLLQFLGDENTDKMLKKKPEKQTDKSSSVIFMKMNVPGIFTVNQEKMTRKYILKVGEIVDNYYCLYSCGQKNRSHKLRQSFSMILKWFREPCNLHFPQI